MLEQAITDAPGDFDPEKLEGKSLVKKAVARELERVRAKPVPEPETELRREIKCQTEAPKSLIDRVGRNGDGKVLKNLLALGEAELIGERPVTLI